MKAQQYRRLEAGETIQQGDEFQIGESATWRVTIRHGQTVPVDTPYRRPIPAPEPASGEAGQLRLKPTHFTRDGADEWLVSWDTETQGTVAILNFGGKDGKQMAAALCERYNAHPALLSERNALLAKLERAKAALRELLQAEHDARKTPGHGPGSLCRAAKRAAIALAELD